MLSKQNKIVESTQTTDQTDQPKIFWLFLDVDDKISKQTKLIWCG